MVKLTRKFVLGASGPALAAALAIAPTLNPGATVAAPAAAAASQFQGHKAAETAEIVHHYPPPSGHHYP